MADGIVEILVKLLDEGVKPQAEKLAATLGKTGAAAAAAFAASTAVITKQALDLYAAYEQLAGGVDTIFGEQAAAKVKAYASAAYESAGLSANQYMDTVTQFSAALINSLGGDTEAAADIANQAISDMADNANKMGTSMETIQQTYSSLARGNYAMLDNLKLGYAGTKEGLKELMEAAEAYQASQGNMVDYSVDSYADIIAAIHDVQTQMGLTRATAMEAATTIEGSAKMARAAWENWLTGLGDTNADMGELTQRLADSVVAAAKNAIPRIGVIVTALVGALATSIPDALSGIAEQIGPLMFDLLQAVAEAIPQMAASGFELASSLVLGMVEAIPRLMTLLSSTLLETGLPMLLASVMKTVTGIVNALPGLVASIVDFIPEFIASLVGALVGNMPALVQGFVSLFRAFTVALPQILATLSEEIPQIIDTIVELIGEFAPELVTTAVTLFMALLQGLWKAAPEILMGLADLLDKLLGKAAELPGKMLEIGVNVVKGLWDGISGMVSWVLARISEFADTIVGGLMDILGIHSPSTVMRDQVGRYMAEGVGVGFEKYNPVKDIQDSLLSDVTSLGVSARLSASSSATTNYFTIERIDAHDLAGVNNVNALVELFNANA